jgi:transposase
VLILAIHSPPRRPGVGLCLSPGSPAFKPIEQALAKLKASLRKTAARTPAALEAAIAPALTTITAADAFGWFCHRGYELLGYPACKPL